MTKMLILSAFVLAAVGCKATSPLDKRYVSVRPNYGDKPLPNPGETPPPSIKPLEIVNPDPTGNPPSRSGQTVITGTWTFTTPATTTRLERKNEGFSQYSIYNGRPTPDAKPLVVITTSPDTATQAESDPDTFKVTGKRTYLLHGNPTKEWTGTTPTGTAFTELLISKPSANGSEPKGDFCHAIAIANTDTEKKLALQILSSITWTPAVGQ